MNDTEQQLCATASQTVGPFYHFALTANSSLGCLVQPETRGERIRIRVRIVDGADVPVSDGMIEIWQADACGRYAHPADSQPRASDPAFGGFGRLPTNQDGVCIFETIYPGRVESEGRRQAAHINVSIFARGLLRHLCTRLYFAGDPALVEDPVLEMVPQERGHTLLAKPDESEPGLWNFGIRLQGKDETVFFDI